MAMETVRVRVVLEDPDLLNKTQNSEGLRRSWLLLKPQHKTISDLSSYLLRIFNLHDFCPNGLLLSMDGFVLPSFESTCILKDKEIISVKRKGGAVIDLLEVGDETNCSEDEAIVENQHIHRGVKLLANEEFDKETGGYESESEEDEPDQPEETVQVETASAGNAGSKKRKASRKLKSPKRKKNKYTRLEKCPVVLEDVENGVCEEQTKSCDDCTVLPKKGSLKKHKSSNVNGKPDKARTLNIDERSNDVDESSPNAKRCGELQENGSQGVEVANPPDGTQKYPSRSARRKKAKRKWLRELAKVEKKEVEKKEVDWSPSYDSKLQDHLCYFISWYCIYQVFGCLFFKLLNKAYVFAGMHQRQSPEKEVQKNSLEHQQPDQNSDTDDAVIVPIVIRPGHIRFEPLGKDQTIQQNPVSVETFQWNGTTSKKKGQKWGKEKMSCRRNDYKDFNQQHSETFAVEEGTPPKDPMDFDKLPSLTSSPKEGDMIAYRLIELSSTWTPELSTFRVGKISSYDPESNKLILISVPEYPIVAETRIDEDASALEPDPDTSLYREDGSLEIDFSSLIDVRIIKSGNSHLEKAVTARVEAPVDTQDAVSGVKPNNKNSGMSTSLPGGELNITQVSVAGVEHNINREMTAPPPENGKVNAWDEIDKVLSAKKAQLSQEDGSSKKESSGRSPWSYKALRGSALGPTMSFLRAQNNL
ncbi:Coilin [Vitis vinifera]|uniref:Coilin n=1 Tax=Vitis vinifera TaxID=29760 RepID=A0A438E6X9_VITVI|nr:Coilin [Vitis vinifera]